MANQNIGGLTGLAASAVNTAEDLLVVWDNSAAGAAKTKSLNIPEARKLWNVEITIACSDEISNLTTGNGKVTFPMPCAMTLVNVFASVNTAPTGAELIVDVAHNGVSLFTTQKINIDATELNSDTAVAAPNISTTALNLRAPMVINIDQVGSTLPGKALKVILAGTRR